MIPGPSPTVNRSANETIHQMFNSQKLGYFQLFLKRNTKSAFILGYQPEQVNNNEI